MKKIKGYEDYFHGKENDITAKKLKEGENCVVTGYGRSMTPILKSGQSVFVETVSPDTELKKGDIVFCRVHGHYYLHKIWSVKGKDSFLIGNNHGQANGTIGKANIFGITTKIFQNE